MNEEKLKEVFNKLTSIEAYELMISWGYKIDKDLPEWWETVGLLNTDIYKLLNGDKKTELKLNSNE